MATKPSSRSKESSSVLGAGAAGGGIGTVVASIAASLPADSSYKAFLTICAPLVTVGVSGLWLFVKTVYIDPFVARKSHQANHAYIETLLSDAKRYEESVLADPRATAKHKEEVRKQVERLEIALVQAIAARVNLVELRA